MPASRTENRAWPGAPAASARAGLSRSRYQQVREQLVVRGLVVVDARATGRGRASTVTLAFADAGPVIPKELSSILAVLRRPTRSRDREPSLADDPLVRSDARVIYPSGMRLALTAAGSRYYLLPVMTAPGPGVSQMCAAARQAALRRDSPHIPPLLGAQAERALAALTARQRYESGSHPAVCEAGGRTPGWLEQLPGKLPADHRGRHARHVRVRDRANRERGRPRRRRERHVAVLHEQRPIPEHHHPANRQRFCRNDA